MKSQRFATSLFCLLALFLLLERAESQIMTKFMKDEKQKRSKMPTPPYLQKKTKSPGLFQKKAKSPSSGSPKKTKSPSSGSPKKTKSPSGGSPKMPKKSKVEGPKMPKKTKHEKGSRMPTNGKKHSKEWNKLWPAP